jgi:hypothetical protein
MMLGGETSPCWSRTCRRREGREEKALPAHEARGARVNELVKIKSFQGDGIEFKTLAPIASVCWVELLVISYTAQDL